MKIMADEQMEPIDWSSVKGAGLSDRVGGPRGYQGSEAAQRFPWKCPACGSDQQGPLEAGCGACGSGKAAPKHVGVDPIVYKRKDAESIEEAVATLQPPVQRLSDLHAAFLRWIANAGATVGPLAAFTAGWEARGGSPMQIDEPADVPTTPVADTARDPLDSGLCCLARHANAVPPWTCDCPCHTRAEPALEGTIQSRTIIAALTFFADQVLKAGPEEVITGEWLNATDTNTLIAELKHTYGIS